MLVADCMTRHPAMISPKSTALEAQQLMRENNVRHLPVIESGKRLVGLITRQRLTLKPDALSSLNVFEITRFVADMTVQQVMVKQKDLITITADRTVERAAEVMTANHVGCLPVIDADNIVQGIVTEGDLLRSFQTMLGLPSEGVRVTVRMPDQPGEFVKLMGVVVEQQWCVMGIGTFPARRKPGYYDIVVKITGVTVEQVSAGLAAAAGQEIVDIRTVA